MKIHAHVNMASELHTAFPDSIQELHVAVQDTTETNLLDWFEKIYDFIGNVIYYMVHLSLLLIFLFC